MTPSGLQSGPLDPESIALATRPPRLPQLVNLGEVFPFQYFLRHGLLSLANTMTIAFVRSRHSDSQGQVEDKRGRYSLSPRESSRACRLRARIARALLSERALTDLTLEKRYNSKHEETNALGLISSSISCLRFLLTQSSSGM